jgi:hypothetical protein
MTNEIVQKNKKNRHRYNKQSRLVSFEEEVVPKNAAEQILLKETPVNVDDKSKKKKKKGIDTSVDAHEETVDEVANMHEVCENSKSKKKKKKTKIEQSEGSMEESMEPKNEESKREHKQKRNAAQITRNEETESVSENVEIGDGQDYKPKKKKKKNHDKQSESDENGLPPNNTEEKKKRRIHKSTKTEKTCQTPGRKKGEEGAAFTTGIFELFV